MLVREQIGEGEGRESLPCPVSTHNCNRRFHVSVLFIHDVVGHWEVERRFLAGEGAPDSDPMHIIQVYLELHDLKISHGRLHHQKHGIIADFGNLGEEVEGLLTGDEYSIVRIRKIGDEFLCGVKGRMVEGRRKEFEIRTLFDPNQIREGSALVEKTRCLWKGEDGLIWEIDRYIRPQLNIILAEVELDYIEQSINLPDWIIEEGTYDPRFTNSELAKLTMSAGGGI